MLFALAPSVAMAQAKEKPKAAKVTLVALFPLEVQGVEQKVSTIVTDSIQVELAKLPGARVIGAREIDAMLGYEQKKQMAGCTETSCIVAIGGALGVDKIVMGNIGKLGTSYMMNVKLLNIRDGTVEALYNRRLKGGSEEDFLDIVPEAISKLFPGNSGVLSRKDARAQSSLDASTSGVNKVMPWVLMGTGAAAVVTGAVLHVFAAGAYSDYRNLPENDPDLGSKKDSVQIKETTAYVLYGAGAALAAGGVAWYFLAANRSAKSASSLDVTPCFVGMQGFVVSGRW